MSYIELEEVALDKKLTDEEVAKLYREHSTKELVELQKDDEFYKARTTFIDDDHPAWIAAEKARKAHREGKTLTPKQILQQLKDGTFYDDLDLDD
jgi:hypothetical protein